MRSDRDDIPWQAIAQTKGPPQGAFNALIAELIKANQAAEESGDLLGASFYCLVEVLKFIDATPQVKAAGLTRPLGALARALYDLVEGGKPPLFFEQSERGRGRPKNKRSFEVCKGYAAAAATMLFDEGEPRDAAGKIIADDLSRAGIQMPDGEAIIGKQVLRWRDEIGATASALTTWAYNDALEKRARLDPRRISEALRYMGF